MQPSTATSFPHEFQQLLTLYERLALPCEEAHLPAILHDLITTLEQGYELIVALDDDAYVLPPRHLVASSIGAHYRHHLEHVQMLLQNLRGGIVDYDCRPRSARVEQDRDFALAMTRDLIQHLSALAGEDLDVPLTIAHRTCTQDNARCAPSTLRRELLFLLSHTIHHYALIKLIAESLGQEVHGHFGVMPSTLAHLGASSPASERSS